MAIEIRTFREVDGGILAVAGDAAVPWAMAVARDDDEEAAMSLAETAHLEAVRSRTVSASLLSSRLGGPQETYEQYLRWHGILDRGFGFGELVRRRSADHVLPPPTVWQNILAPLALAHLLRERMKAAGAGGIVIAAAYRPASRRRRSRHKVNAALDLDILAVDHELAPHMLMAGAALWAAHKHLKIGVGSYHQRGTRATRRLHVDAGQRWTRAAWQYSGDLVIKPPAVSELARDLRG